MSQYEKLSNSDLSGKVLVVWGGGDGPIAGEVARDLSRRGAQLVLAGVETAPGQLRQLAASCDRVAKHGNRWQMTAAGKWQPVQRALFIPVRDDDGGSAVAAMISAVLEQLGRVDSLVFMWPTAGGPSDAIGTPTLVANLDRVFRQQLGPFVRLVQGLATPLEQSGGTVVNLVPAVASGRCLSGSVAHTAVDMLVKCLALELGPKRVRINSISYRAPDGPNAVVGFEVNQQLVDQYLERWRGADAGDQVAAAVLYLVSARGAFLNGVHLQVAID